MSRQIRLGKPLAGRKRNQRVSSIFKLKRSQATLDFVDVDVERVTKVFVSPRALSLMQTDWGDGCVSLMQSFFETVLQHIKAGDHVSAETLLRELREPNETHLGMSHGKSRGRALGEGSAHDVWGALSQSAAAKSGLVQDLEDTVLLIPGIGIDIVSDISINIIRGPLIEYTQQQCRQLGIRLSEGVPSGPIWHAGRREWITHFVALPMTKTGKLLLVPKAIVRRTSLYDIQYYYRHHMLEHMQREELKAGSALIKIVKKTPRVHKSDLIEKYGSDKNAVITQTVKYPQVLEDYKREINARPFLPLSHEDFEDIESQSPVDWDRLLDDVKSLPTGNDSAGAYEKSIEALLTALLYPDLASPVYQSELHQGRKRIDIRYTNMAGAGFFEWLSKHYTAPHIFVECKNYGNEIANPELDQISSRFGRSRGEFGIIICRKFKNKTLFQKRCRDTALDGRGFVIALDDADLTDLVETRKTQEETEYRKLLLLQDRFNALLS